MTALAIAPAPPAPTVATPVHPVTRVVYRDSDHSYRLRYECATCLETGTIPGVRPGTTKKCTACKGEGAKFERVPAVSTILSELNKPALVHWAARMAADAVAEELQRRGAERLDLAAVIPASEFALVCQLAQDAHKNAKDEAADIGTRVHDWITTAGADILDTPLPDDPELRGPCEAYVTWWRSTGYTVVEVERIVVDNHARYAGRFDLLVRDARGRLLVLDIKTSNSVYLEHVLQLAAYAKALREEIGVTISGTAVVWCHKDGRPVSTITRTAREYRADFRVFAALFGVYAHRKALGGELRRVIKESEVAAAADAYPFL
ncbi:MAG: nuclease superfamily protein [Thermoleophilia bacterium]|nr:nuclease superfamily protein [Thermoleophilia bacterium]